MECAPWPARKFDSMSGVLTLSYPPLKKVLVRLLGWVYWSRVSALWGSSTLDLRLSHHTMLAGRSIYIYIILIPWSHTLFFRWLPIMHAYEQGKPSYFATPPVNLIYALRTSLTRIVRGSPSLEDRFRLHRETSRRIRQALKDLGLKQVCNFQALFYLRRILKNVLS